jgi:hypothetical protein
MHLVFCRLYPCSPHPPRGVWALPFISLLLTITLYRNAGLPNHMMGEVSWDPKRRRSLVFNPFCFCKHFLDLLYNGFFFFFFRIPNFVKGRKKKQKDRDAVRARSAPGQVSFECEWQKSLARNWQTKNYIWFGKYKVKKPYF